MRRILTAAIAAVLLSHANPALAQAPAAARFWFSVSGGSQTPGKRLNDAFDRTLYTEKEPIAVGYPVKSGVLVAASGGYRIWKKLEIGLGVTHYGRSGSAKVTAQLPHPFFDNAYRPIEGSTRATRDETAAHLLFGYALPVSDRFRVLLTAGPSVLNVGQTIVSDVTYSEAYPYDTAVFTGTVKKNATRAAAGFNAGADLFWMFSRTVGAGGLVQFTRARVRESAGGRSVSFDAGGVQAGAGLRFVF